MSRPSNEAGAPRPASGLASHNNIRSRAHSISSDRPSTVGYGLMSPPISVSPEAAFIAASAASQIVTNDHDSHANTWYDEHGIEPSGETAIVTNAALQLINNFLDQLLFSFLSLSHSTSLAALRPAVTEVLKPKLAKDAINQADEELREYLGGGDDDDMLQSQRPTSAKDWDVELVWKRTRLRCMVYSSLGDLEEEDEDLYMEQEHLETAHDPTSETVSPAVSIFLTSILEFMAEQALISASQAAFHRMRFIYEKDRRDPTSPRPTLIANRITVEEVDMERVAFDRTIGRLWRSWKKRIRSPTIDVHHSLPGPFSDDASRPSIHLRQYSENVEEGANAKLASELVEAENNRTKNEPRQLTKEDGHNAVQIQEQSEHSPQHIVIPLSERATAYMTNEEWLSAAIAVPLPTNERDIAEILIPGFTHYDDEEAPVDRDDGIDVQVGKKWGRLDDKGRRPQSLLIPPSALTIGLPTPTTSEPHTPELPSRKRANSLPTPTTSPFSSPRTKRVKAAEGDSLAAMEEAAPVSEEANAEGAKEYVAPDSKQKRGRLVPPLITTTIGAAITTNSARAVPIAGMMTEEQSDNGDEIDEEFDEFTEEPEILTSSRISISGRSNSPTTSDLGRPLSICPILSPGSPNPHSPRVIDVTGPRSPISRSRGSSIDAQDMVLSLSRVSDLSRASSISTQPIAEEDHSPSEATAAPKVPLIGVKTPRAYKSESISEAEEADAEPVQSTRKIETVSALAVMPKPIEAVQAQPQLTEPVKDSAVSADAYSTPISSPLHPLPPPLDSNYGTKVTILGPTALSGSFFIDDTQQDDVAEQPQEISKVAPISIPERSSKREAFNASSVTAAAVTVAVATAASAGSFVQRSRSLRETRSPLGASERPLSIISQEPDVLTEANQSQMHAQSSAQSPSSDAQPSHTADSSMSSIGSKLKPVRTSEENIVIRSEDVARNFEQLIQSDQTIQYTLTPENMRDIDATRSSYEGSILPKSRRSEDTRPTGDRSRSSSLATNKQSDIRRSPSIASRTTANEALSAETTQNQRLNGPVPRLPHRLTASVSSASLRSRPNAPQARDARIPQESLADFAEFIRATGPSVDEGRSAVLRKNSGGGGGRPTTSTSRNVSSPATMIKSSLGRKLSAAGSSRSRFQARGATVDYKDDKSDLIDFIRRGPPETAENPRIPRTVAPFQTPMDSDQMAGAAGGRAVDATISSLRYSASTNVTESSVNSSTGLLRNKASPPGGAVSNNNTFDAPDAMPKRKTRRVKDPYAIDLSDEDDEELYASVGRGPKPAAKEESLLDFLNSVPPPPEPQRRPFDVPQTRSQKQAPRKKASTSSLMSRFAWGSSSHSHSGSTGGRGLFSSSGGEGSSFKGSRSEARSLSSRAGSAIMGRGHVPIQAHIPENVDKYGTTTVVSSTTNGVSTSLNNNTGTAGSSGRVLGKKYEPREAQNVPSATRDLAEFFRNSGPAQPQRG
ncbi:hypothetical protein CMQ_2529 [Grosmannia clavigera kw1407]|uniref:Flo11 n=1 Tax=Grosmannia clavigera (strain kw1407 / UAMH 11150) TaxID=655863 RepID=F0XGR4_GROCL|nr:uncharacterized protein CMQ_2529 [Grosmannia clavigera kw1407]EFX02600.1 hypothetical protein CMQ_2529 [Grosmannia clavigera kw1407]